MQPGGALWDPSSSSLSPNPPLPPPPLPSHGHFFSSCSSSGLPSDSGVLTLSVRTIQVGRWRFSIRMSCCRSCFSSSIWVFSSAFMSSNRSDSCTQTQKHSFKLSLGPALPLGWYKHPGWHLSVFCLPGSHWRKHKTSLEPLGGTLSAVPITPVTVACVPRGVSPGYMLRPAWLISHPHLLTQSISATVTSLLLLKYAKHSPASGPLHKKQRVGEEWRPNGSRADVWRVDGVGRGGPRMAVQWQSALMCDRHMLGILWPVGSISPSVVM